MSNIKYNLIMKTFYCFIICICYSLNLSAQQASTSTGGNASGTNGNISYSVGLVNYTVNKTTSGSVSQGVQIPYEIFILTGVDDTKKMNINLTVFPNPTNDYLMLTIESTSIKNLSYQLLNNNGKQVASQKLEGTSTKVDMNNFAAAPYFITITENNKVIKSFKIIKN